MIDIYDYQTIYREKSFFITGYILIIGFILSLVYFVFKSTYYENYYVNSGVLMEENNLKVYVLDKDLDKITTNNKLKIKNKEFAYTIKSISDVLFNTNYYYEVVIESDLPSNLNINNNLIEFKILLDKKTILKYIYQKIGGIDGKS